MSDFVEIAGIRVPRLSKDAGWIPETQLVLTPTTRRNLQKILPPLLHGHNILLIGDAGVGKNALLYYINTLRSCPTVRYSFNEDTLPEDLVGAYRIDPLTKNFIWSDGPLSYALRQGASFVADEMNLSSPELLKRFYSVFTDRYLQLLEGDASILRAQAAFNFVATQNPAQNFAGRKDLPREIRKYFSCIYIDPYTLAEQADIIKGLFPSLSKAEVDALVQINNEIEGLVIQCKVGGDDLEHYHFNLRNLKRLAKRLSDKKEKYWESELGDIYLAPFRHREERELAAQKLSHILAKQLSYACDFSDFLNTPEPKTSNSGRESINSSALYAEAADPSVDKQKEAHIEEAPLGIHADSKERKIYIGRACLEFLGAKDADFKKALEEACALFPPLPQTLKTLEAIACAIAQKENILLESIADVEAEDYVYFFSRLLGRPLQVITLSRGMHTSDIIGALKPRSKSINFRETSETLESAAQKEQTPALKKGPLFNEPLIEWIDGPLSTALRSESFILLRGLEAAGPELVEKLNMLLDDAQALLLPAESGEKEPLILSEKTRIFAIKFFRTQRNIPTISRAFRNRFSAFSIDPITDRESLMELSAHLLAIDHLKHSPLLGTMIDFHSTLRIQAKRRQLGAANPQAYEFGLSNLRRWCQYIVSRIENQDRAQEERAQQEERSQAGSASVDPQKLKELIAAAAGFAYTNEIADPQERQRALKMLEELMGGQPPETFIELLTDLKKKSDILKGRIKGSSYQKRIWWDQKKHWRKPNTGKFKRKLHGEKLKKGIRINTPETGGNRKEGPDAWYGSDTLGNKGQGEPGSGGGAWGYRTEELYQEFIRKRRNLWNYDMDLSLAECKTIFQAELQKMHLNFERLLEPSAQLKRLYRQEGSRVDARRYLAYIAGQGDERIFDKSTVTMEKEQLQGIELLFAVNKGRRIFNFEYSLATVLALLGAALLLKEYRFPFGAAGYSDLSNLKENVNVVWYKQSQEEWDPQNEEDFFSGLTQGWHGDTSEETPVLEALARAFSKPSARTRILTVFSDFRGFRGKSSIQEELGSSELKEFKEKVDSLKQEGIVCLGVGLGPRSLAEYIFEENLQIRDENFANLASLLAAKMSEVIHKYHKIS